MLDIKQKIGKSIEITVKRTSLELFPLTLNCTHWRSGETDLWGLGCPSPLRANATPLLPPPPLLPMPRLPTQSAAK